MKKNKKGFGLVSAIIITMVIVTFLLALLTAASMGIAELRNHMSEMQASLKSKCALEFAKAYYLNADVNVDSDFSEYLIINYSSANDSRSTYDVPASIEREKASEVNSVSDVLFEEKRQSLSCSVVEAIYIPSENDSMSGKLKLTAYTKYDGMSLNIETASKISCTFNVSVKTIGRSDEITYRFDEIETFDVVNSIDADDDRYRYVTIHVKPAVGSDLAPYIYAWTGSNKKICTWVPPVYRTTTINGNKYYDYSESKNTAGPTAAMEYEGNGWYRYTVKFDTWSDFGKKLDKSSSGKFSVVIAEKGSVKNVPQSMYAKVNNNTVETPPAREDTQTFDIFDLPVSTLKRSDVYITLNSEYFYNPSNYDGYLDSLTNAEMKELLDKSYTAYVEDNYVNVNARIAGVSDDTLPLTLGYTVNGENKSAKMVYQGYGWYKLIIKGGSPTSFSLQYSGSGSQKKTNAVANPNTHELYLVSGKSADYNLRAFQTEGAANEYLVNTLYDKYAADYSTVNIKIPSADSSTTVAVQADYTSSGNPSGSEDTLKMTVYFEAPTGWGLSSSNMPKIVSVDAALGVSGDYEAAMEYCAEDIYSYTFEYSESKPMPSQIYFSNNGVNNILYKTVNISVSDQCADLIYKVNKYEFSTVSKISIYYLLDPATASGGWYKWNGTLQTTNGKFIYAAVANMSTYNNLTLQVKYSYSGNTYSVDMTPSITTNNTRTFKYYYAIIPPTVSEYTVYYKTKSGKSEEMKLDYTGEDRIYYLYQNNFGKDKNAPFGGISPSTVNAGSLSTTTTVTLKKVGSGATVQKTNSEKSAVIKTAQSSAAMTATLIDNVIAEDFKRIYFYASSTIFSQWENIKAYVYNTENDEWTTWANSPRLRSSGGLYYIDIPEKYYYVIFRNGDGSKQTPTLTVSGKEREYIACAYDSGEAYCTKLTYRTVYFIGASSYGNNNNTVYAYYWNKDKAAVKWSGAAMTKCKSGVYKFQVPVSMKNIIFNNGSSQTSDLVIPATSSANAYDLTKKRWTFYNAPVTNYLASANSYDEKTQKCTTVANMIINSGYKKQYYDVKSGIGSYGTIDGDRRGTTKAEDLYDWYTYKIPANGVYSVKFVISKGSAKYATVAMSNLYSDVYVNVNSYNSSKTSGLIDDISLYTINPERENMATGTVIYFNNVAGWSNPNIKYGDINGEYTEQLKNNAQDNIWYYEIPVNCTYFTFISGDGTQATGRYSITNGINYYNNGGDPPGVFKTQKDKLLDAINNAVGVLNTCGLYQISTDNEYFVSEKNPPQYMEVLAQKIKDAQVIYEKGYALTSSGTADFNRTAQAASELTSLSSVTQSLYKQIKKARIYIDGYPESKSRPSEYVVDALSQKLIRGAHDAAVGLYGDSYSTVDAACRAIKAAGDKLEKYLSNIQLNLQKCVVLVLQNNAGWNTDTGKIYIDIDGASTELDLLSGNGYYTYLYKYSGDIQNNKSILFKYTGNNSSGGVTTSIGSNLLPNLSDNYDGQTWVYNNETGEWNRSTAGDTYVVASDSISEEEVGNAYIKKSDGVEKFKVYFKYDTTVSFGKYTDSKGKVRYDKYTYVIYSGEYNISDTYNSTSVDFFTVNAMKYFSDPKNFGFEITGENNNSSEDIGLTAGGKLKSASYYNDDEYVDQNVNILIGGTQKEIYGNNSDVYKVNAISAENGKFTDIDLWADSVNFRWVTGDGFVFEQGAHIGLYSDKVSIAAESIGYHSESGSDFTVGEGEKYNYLVVKNNIVITDLDDEVSKFTIKTGTYKFYGKINLLDYYLWKNNAPGLISLSTSSDITTINQSKTTFSNLEGGMYDN